MLPVGKHGKLKLKKKKKRFLCPSCFQKLRFAMWFHHYIASGPPKPCDLAMILDLALFLRAQFANKLYYIKPYNEMFVDWPILVEVR